MSLIVRDYLCPSHGVFEQIEEREIPTEKGSLCPKCNARSEYVMPAPRIKTCWATAATTAKSDGPPHRGYMNTADIADGYADRYQAGRDQYWEDDRNARIKKLYE